MQHKTSDRTFQYRQVVYQSKDDQVTVVAAGVTLHEALAAAEHLKKGRTLKNTAIDRNNMRYIVHHDDMMIKQIV